jgi:hypothetical protein
MFSEVTLPHSLTKRQRGERSGTAVAILALAFLSACSNGRGLVLSEQLEARRLAADMHVQFSRAVEAANRAVMADTDDASTEGARAARQARQTVQQDSSSLRGLLQQLGYTDDLALLDAFDREFSEYMKLDDPVLELAVENSNLKAQRLSFGDSREAADAFDRALQSAARTAPSTDSWQAQALAVRGQSALLEVQALQARHIAEADDAKMSAMESQMGAAMKAATDAVAALKSLTPRAPSLSDAAAALERFKSTNDEIVRLSRRNTNVRSLALALGKKRTLVSACEDALTALADALQRHEFKATR